MTFKTNKESVGKFLVFQGYHFYPTGGWNDFRQSFNSKEDALLWIAKNPMEWSEIVEIEVNEIREININCVVE